MATLQPGPVPRCAGRGGDRSGQARHSLREALGNDCRRGSVDRRRFREDQCPWSWVLFTSTIPLSQLPKSRGATYRTPPPSCVSQCNLPANDDMVNLATELAAPAWLALRNPSSAKRKCRRIRNTLILGASVPVKNYSLGRGPRVLMSMVSAIAW